jgi:primosomal protein N' (replication factor Y)
VCWGYNTPAMSLRQPELFASTDAEPSLFCDVAVPLPLRGALTYAVPAGMARHVAPGVRVIVPVHGKRLVGYVLGVSERAPAGVPVEVIKPIFHLVEADPVFPDDLLRFLREAADYYLHPIGEVLRTAAPAIDRRRKATTTRARGDAGRAGEGERGEAPGEPQGPLAARARGDLREARAGGRGRAAEAAGRQAGADLRHPRGARGGVDDRAAAAA